jgi:hypothetical protein
MSIRLLNGFLAWADANSSKYDLAIWFSVENVLALESAIPPDQQVGAQPNIATVESILHADAAQHHS